jgi:hypothetical protein
MLPSLYRCDTWSLTLSEEHRLRVFDVRVLRTVLDRKREGVSGGWLGDEDSHDLCCSE